MLVIQLFVMMKSCTPIAQANPVIKYEVVLALHRLKSGDSSLTRRLKPMKPFGVSKLNFTFPYVSESSSTVYGQIFAVLVVSFSLDGGSSY